jgi:glycosyltransferase involved in cell wall biosynthesis
MGLSCFIITHNEARKLNAVIHSVRDLVDEVVVIDSGSTDDTVLIAEAAGARVVYRQWPGYGPQKRFGEDECRNDWVINLDGDEVLSEGLREEIRGLFASGEPALPCYWVRIMAHAPYGPNRPWRLNYIDRIRIYKKSIVRFPDHPTWDAIAAPPVIPVKRLQNPVLHYWMADFAHQIDKMNRYTTALADSVPKKSMTGLTLRLFFGFPVDFFRAYFLRGHFAGGRYGFAIAMLYAFTRLMRTVKMMERQWQRN